MVNERGMLNQFDFSQQCSSFARATRTRYFVVDDSVKNSSASLIGFSWPFILLTLTGPVENNLLLI